MNDAIFDDLIQRVMWEMRAEFMSHSGRKTIRRIAFGKRLTISIIGGKLVSKIEPL